MSVAAYIVIALCLLGAAYFLGLLSSAPKAAPAPTPTAPTVPRPAPAPVAPRPGPAPVAPRPAHVPAAPRPAPAPATAPAPAPAESGFDIGRSQVAPNALATFINAAADVPVEQVPGVGPEAARMLHRKDIRLTVQLIGQFLRLREAGMNTRQHAAAFWGWLRDAGITSHRSGIVTAIGTKTDTLLPGLFNREELE